MTRSKLTSTSRVILIAFISLVLSSCSLWSLKPPQDSTNICRIFEQRSAWYKAAKRAEKKWRIPIATSMAFIFHESGYRARVRPPRKPGFLFFPGRRLSSAYGFAQAKTSTWRWYQESTGQHRSERHSFADAIDFVGWYNDLSASKYNIPRSSIQSLYYAYHEGHGGYQRKTYQKKPGLLRVARKVSDTAASYNKQLTGCRKQLDRPWWKF